MLREPPQLARGKRAHREEAVLPGELREVPTPSGRRMDRYNPEAAHIREIKPDNPRQIRMGERQVEEYRREMEAANWAPSHHRGQSLRPHSVPLKDERAMNLKTVAPTPSYTLQLPAEAQERIEDDVASFWVPGDDTLLQLSSHTRESGRQVGARERLRTRLGSGQLRNARDVTLLVPACADVAAASGEDEDGTSWLYVYLVWPRLMILATVSRPRPHADATTWADSALRTIVPNQREK